MASNDWRSGSQEGGGDEPSGGLERAEFYGGPLPHPEILKGFESVVPGSGERILSMAEAQLQHRHAMEREGQAANIRAFEQGRADAVAQSEREARLGLSVVRQAMWIGAVLAVLFIVSAAFLIYSDKSIEGFAVLAGGLGFLTWGGVRALMKLHHMGQQQPAATSSGEAEQTSVARPEN